DQLLLHLLQLVAEVAPHAQHQLAARAHRIDDRAVLLLEQAEERILARLHRHDLVPQLLEGVLGRATADGDRQPQRAKGRAAAQRPPPGPSPGADRAAPFHCVASTPHAPLLPSIPVRVPWPAVTWNSARRFMAHARSFDSRMSGCSSPMLAVSKRLASRPRLTRKSRTAFARRRPRARLYSSEPRSSACPTIRTRTSGSARRTAALRRSVPWSDG